MFFLATKIKQKFQQRKSRVGGREIPNTKSLSSTPRTFISQRQVLYVAQEGEARMSRGLVDLDIREASLQNRKRPTISDWSRSADLGKKTR
jgi:hypothetical protein